MCDPNWAFLVHSNSFNPQLLLKIEGFPLQLSCRTPRNARVLASLNRSSRPQETERNTGGGATQLAPECVQPFSSAKPCYCQLRFPRTFVPANACKDGK